MRYAAPTLALLLFVVPAAQAAEEFRFTGEIVEWASLFGALQTPEQAAGNPPIPYLGILVLGDLNNEWTFRFEVGVPPFVAGDGVDPSLLSEDPAQLLNTVFNTAASLEVDLFHLSDFASGEGNVLNFDLDKPTSTGEWSWARFRNCPACDFIELDPSAQATITAFTVLPERAGDFNDDRIVSAADFTVIRDSLGSLYRGQDLTAFQDAFGSEATATAAVEARPVPEPVSAMLALAGLALPAVVTRRRN